MASVNYDRLAPYYVWLERLVFASQLQRCRLHYIDRIVGARRLLLLGDGDGRLLQQVLRRCRDALPNDDVCIDVVDTSSVMNQLSSARLTREARCSVHYHTVDARDFVFEAGHYDAILTAFFLDGFDSDQVATLTSRILAALSPSGLWLDADFNIPPLTAWSSPTKRLSGLVVSVFCHWRARLWVGFLYRAFAVLTGLSVRRLQNIETLLHATGGQLLDRHERCGGLLASRVMVRAS